MGGVRKRDEFMADSPAKHIVCGLEGCLNDDVEILEYLYSIEIFEAAPEEVLAPEFERIIQKKWRQRRNDGGLDPPKAGEAPHENEAEEKYGRCASEQCYGCE